MLTHEKLETALIALRHIADGGEGASGHIAAQALKEIEEEAELHKCTKCGASCEYWAETCEACS